MEKEVLKKNILDVIRKYPIASLATVKEGKPWVRYIIIDADDALNLVAISFAQSRKIDQIKQDNNVHIVFGADSQDMKKPFINVEATAEICMDIKPGGASGGKRLVISSPGRKIRITQSSKYLQAGLNIMVHSSRSRRYIAVGGGEKDEH